MIHHVTQRCALIRMCREVRAVAIAMDKNAVATPKAWFVLVIYAFVL